MNLGACFTDYDGNITEEIPNLTGAYIDQERGCIEGNGYIAGRLSCSSFFSERRGVSYLRLSVFFTENLQENVKKRVEAYLDEK